MAAFCLRPRVRSLLVLSALTFLPLAVYFSYSASPVSPVSSLVLQMAPSITLGSQSNVTGGNLSFEQTLLNHANPKGEIILASVDYGFVDMALNLYESSFKRFNLNNYLFVSSDSRAAEVLDEHGIANFEYFADKDGDKPSDYRSQAFARKTHYKTKIVLDALKLGLTVLLTDVDIVFLKNPFPFMDCEKCDLQISSDVSEGNSGFYLVRPSKASIELHQKAWDGGMANPKKSNQKQIASVLGSMLKKKTINRKTLGLKTFPCGVVYYDQAQRMFAGDNPCKDCVIVHNNWIVSGQGKIYRFKEHLMWYVDTEGYYTDTERKYFTYGNPHDFGAKDNLQLETKALKAALSIGHILNRTLILPVFHCDPCKEGPCKNPGKRCALNTFYKMAKFDVAFDGEYREHVFLRHDWVPDSVKQSQSDVIYFDGVAGAPTVSTQQPVVEDGSVHFSPSQPKTGVTRDELTSWLATDQYSQISVLNLHSLYGNWSALLEGQTQADFREKLQGAFKRASYRQFDV